MAKLRVYDLAKELAVTNKEILEAAAKCGIEGKRSHSNSLTEEEAEAIRRYVLRGALLGEGISVSEESEEVLKKGKDGQVIAIKRRGNVIRRRKATQPVQSTQQEDKFSSNRESSDSPTSTVAHETDMSLDKGSSEEGRTKLEHTTDESSEFKKDIKDYKEKLTSDEASLEEVNFVKREVKETTAAAKETEETRGPKVLGVIDLPRTEKKQEVKTKKDKKYVSKKLSEIGEAIKGKITVDEDEAIQEKTSKGQKGKKTKRVSRKKEFSRVDLVDYDGQASKRQAKKKAKKANREEIAKTSKNKPVAPEQPKVVKIDEVITVGELAAAMSKKAGEVIAKLMELGQMATINHPLDFDTASLIAEEFGYKAESVEFNEEAILNENIVEKAEDFVSRPPVVTVMGHVDHGKTSLLDAIRDSDVAKREHGGITQHIGAYQVNLPSGGVVTFIDTPGHEAFTEMRARGAQVTDIVVLVVAADDGVMPQTIEAINHAKAANVPIVVAVNKIDKEGANPDRVKQQLAEHGLVPEDWGGDVMFFPVSALKKQGLEDLLEGILLQAEILELKANPNRPARGTVIEAKQDKFRGSVATVLIQHGVLHKGDTFVCGTVYGRVRTMVDYQGSPITEAGPSQPVEITGLNGVPQAGDDFWVVKNESAAKAVAKARLEKQHKRELIESRRTIMSLEELTKKAKEKSIKELNIIVKADYQGSVEAIRSALSQMVFDDVRVKIVHSAVGAINESDVKLAHASNAIIIGFNLRAESRAQREAESYGIEIRYYSVIYDLIDDIKSALAGLLPPVRKEIYLGKAEVRETFVVPKVGTVAGCYVLDGLVKRNAHVRVLRDNIVVYESTLKSLKRFKDDVKEVQSGYECGLAIEQFNDVKVGDVIEVFEVKEEKREL